MSIAKQPMTLNELLPIWEDWLAELGFSVPYLIRFRIGERIQVRVTRIATLDELALAIDALEEDIARLDRGAPALTFYRVSIDDLLLEKAALVELQTRANVSACSGPTTVIEALFPEIVIKRKTAAEEAEIERWLTVRREEGLKIDPETAEIACWYGQTMDPYGVDPDLPEELQQYGAEYFARRPDNNIWVSFMDLPDETREKIWARSKYYAWWDVPESTITDRD
jgi:hypothetical protein